VTGHPLHWETLRKLLRYDGDTGRLFWLPRDSSEPRSAWWQSMYADKEALTSLSDGYRCGIIKGKTYKAHRVIWAMHFGYWPDGGWEIDHIDGNRTNNRLPNLRLVTRADNCRNRARGARNKSGHVGVAWSPRHNSWYAHIGIGNRKTKTLGYFKSIDDAVHARKAAEIQFGFHSNHGRS